MSSPAPSGYTTPLLGGSRTPPPPSPFAYLPARLLEPSKRNKVTVERHNLRGFVRYYTSDFYHTLVNCRWYHFYLLFVVFYVTMYCSYATLYMSQPTHCITKVKTFLHALWFSVQTSATIGYGHQAPDPDCYILQFGIMAQVLTSLLMQASLLGLVFARISNSSGRSHTIRFSKVLSMYRGQDGVYRLAFRVANLRQHQVLQPEVRMLMLRRQPAPHLSSGGWEYVYSELPAQHVGGGQLWLGVPSVIEHTVDARSPLYGMSEGDMLTSDLEIIVLLDGIDESTSRAIEARHSYVPADIRWQHQFDPVIQRRRSGKLGVDFSLFDATQRRSAPEAPFEPSGSAAAAEAAAVGELCVAEPTCTFSGLPPVWQPGSVAAAAAAAAAAPGHHGNGACSPGGGMAGGTVFGRSGASGDSGIGGPAVPFS